MGNRLLRSCTVEKKQIHSNMFEMTPKKHFKNVVATNMSLAFIFFYNNFAF